MKPRTMQQLLIAGLIVLFTMVFGTVGYIVIEGWTLSDAFYMTILSISTTGFREVNPLSEAGKILTIFVIIVGLVSLAYFGGRLVQTIIENYLLRRRRRMDAKLRRLKNHYIVCGFGRMGRNICQDLLEANVRFVVIEKDQAYTQQLEDAGYLYVLGDAASDEILMKAGIQQANGLIAVVSSDAENIYTTLSAKSLNPNIKVVARALQDESESKLKKAGADRVIKPYELVGHRMAQLVLRPGIEEFIDTVVRRGGKSIMMEEIAVEPASCLVGQSLRDSPIRKELNIIIVVIHRADGELIYNPSPDVRIEPRDRMIAIGDRVQLEQFAGLCTEC
ncbi:MAG: potassium channel family protein [Spirochaetota bacterium]